MIKFAEWIKLKEDGMWGTNTPCKGRKPSDGQPGGNNSLGTSTGGTSAPMEKKMKKKMGKK